MGDHRLLLRLCESQELSASTVIVHFQDKICVLMLSAALCAGMAAPTFAYGGDVPEEVEQPVLTATSDEEDNAEE